MRKAYILLVMALLMIIPLFPSHVQAATPVAQSSIVSSFTGDNTPTCGTGCGIIYEPVMGNTYLTGGYRYKNMTTAGWGSLFYPTTQDALLRSVTVGVQNFGSTMDFRLFIFPFFPLNNFPHSVENALAWSDALPGSSAGSTGTLYNFTFSQSMMLKAGTSYFLAFIVTNSTNSQVIYAGNHQVWVGQGFTPGYPAGGSELSWCLATPSTGNAWALCEVGLGLYYKAYGITNLSIAAGTTFPLPSSSGSYSTSNTVVPSGFGETFRPNRTGLVAGIQMSIRNPNAYDESVSKNLRAFFWTNLTGTFGTNAVPFGNALSGSTGFSLSVSSRAIDNETYTSGIRGAPFGTTTFDINATKQFVVQKGSSYAISVQLDSGSVSFDYLGSGAQQGNGISCGACSSWTSAGANFLFSLLVLPFTALPESQSVLFRDDFLYNNPLLETSWIIDAYQTPKVNVGVYTSSGYLVMKATGTGLETVHVTNATYNTAGYTNGTIVKRKMTVAALPFTKTETPETASLKVGMGPLWASGAYPGTSPYGTPMTDYLGLCNSSPAGLDYLRFSSNGTVTYATCATGASNNNKLATGLNPSLYTVFTIVTSGIFCSRCNDNVFLNTSWVYFRVYQENSAGLIISSTDKNLNFTSKISPLNQTSYAFISQENSNGGATGQLSKIDFVQVQNYGSPVCQIGLVAPSGTLCTRLPVNPGRLTSDLVGSIAWIATLLGGGDEQAGVIMLFVILSGGMAGVPLFFTRSLEVGILGELSVLGFFVYAGFLPLWLLVLVFVGGAVMVVLLFQRLVGQHGGGASDG